jgi:hypothetical protein
MYSSERSALPIELVSETELQLDQPQGDLYADPDSSNSDDNDSPIENSIYNFNQLLDSV